MERCGLLPGILLVAAAFSAPATELEERLPFPPFRASAPLSLQERQTCFRLIAQLNAEDYGDRERAQEHLRKADPRLLPVLEYALKTAPLPEWDEPEVANRLTALIKEHVARRAEVLSGILDRETAAVRHEFKPMVPLVWQRLQKKVSFEFWDLPTEDAFAFIERHTGLPIVVDPEVIEASPTIALRITDLPSEWVLYWLCALTDSVWTDHNGGILIGKREGRIRTFGTMFEAVPLSPPADAEEPWTVSETALWRDLILPADVVNDFLISKWRGRLLMHCEAELDLRAVVKGAGALEVRGMRRQLVEFQRMMMEVQAGWEPAEKRFPQLAAWRKVFDAPMARTFEKIRLGGCLEGILGRHKMSLRVPQDAVRDFEVACEDPKKTFGEWLQQICAEHSLAVFPVFDEEGEGVLYLDARQEDMSPIICLVPFSIEVRGLEDYAVGEELNAILKESPFPRKAFQIRERWTGFADVWTVLRMEQRVEHLRKETPSNLSVHPPRPFFFDGWACPGLEEKLEAAVREEQVRRLADDCE